MAPNNTRATRNDHTPAQACPKVRPPVTEHTNDANPGHLSGLQSNAGECRAQAKSVAAIHKIVYLAKTTLLEDTVARTVSHNINKNSLAAHYCVQLSGVKPNSAHKTRKNNKQNSWTASTRCQAITSKCGGSYRAIPQESTMPQ